MKTEAELKKMASFAAEFLGRDLGKDSVHTVPEILFEYAGTASYFAHLAKREVEKRGFEWQGDYIAWSHFLKAPCYKYVISKEQTVFIKDVEPNYEGVHENEYIALWSAIEKTGEKA